MRTPLSKLLGKTKIAGQAIPLHSFTGFPPTLDTTGELESMDFLAGQGVGLVNEIRPAADVVREMMDGARRILATLAGTSGS